MSHDIADVLQLHKNRAGWGKTYIMGTRDTISMKSFVIMDYSRAHEAVMMQL